MESSHGRLSFLTAAPIATVKSKKRCFVSEEPGVWPLRSFVTKRLTLEEVDVLSAFAEAFVLHDQVTYISDGTFPVTVERVVRSLPGSRIVSRYGHHLSIHRFFRGMVNQSIRADLHDLSRAFRALISYPESGFYQVALPARARPVREWLQILPRVHINLMHAELALSRQTGASYYPSPSGQRLVKSELKDFSQAGASLLRAFGSARNAALQTAQAFLQADETDVSPPLILAYAVESAETLQGLIHVLRDLRASREVRDLRSFVARLSTADPPDKIELAQNIKAEFKRILAIKGEPLIEARELIQSIPAMTAQDLLVAAPNAVRGLIKLDELIEQLRVRRSLRILRKAHFRVSSVKALYAGLRRLFGATEFDEISLKAFLERRFVVNRSREELERLKKLKYKTAEMFVRLNKAIEE